MEATLNRPTEVPAPADIDWLKYQDVQLVQMYGKTRERWRQIRRAGGYPDAINKGKNTTRVTLASRLEGMETDEMTFNEIYQKFGGSRDHLKATLKELGKEYKRGH